MDVTKPYEFIGFGARDVTKPYEFIGAMDATKPYEFVGFGAALGQSGKSLLVDSKRSTELEGSQ